MINNNGILIIMDKKVKKVSYIDGHHLDGETLMPTVKDVEIMMSGTKRFHNCLYLILGLSKLQRVLMDWVSEEMDEKNIIRNDKYVRGMFIKFIEDLIIDGEKKTYKDDSVNNAFHGLKVANLLLPVAKGTYQVNPNYYWSGTDKERMDEIMLNIQFSSKETNFKVLPGSKYEVTRKKK